MPYDPDALDWTLDAARYARTLRAARRLRFYYRPRYEGFERLRGARGMMLVANHGLFGLDHLPLLLGVDAVAGRPLRSLSDRVLFLTPALRRAMAAFGSCQGTPAVAHKLLSRGELVYTCPGGAREALAPTRDRYRLLWQGHDGFVRAAIRAGAPIVPLAVIGAEELYREVVDVDAVRSSPLGRLIAGRFGEKYLTPVYLGLGPLPLPQQLRFHCGEPIEVPPDPASAGDEEVVATLHGAVQRETERLIALGLKERAEHLASLSPARRWLDERLLRFAAG